MITEDAVSLGPDCHELCLTQQDIPEMTTHDIRMAGVGRLHPPYSVARRDPENHTLVFTVAGEGLLHTLHGRQAISPNSITLLPAHQAFHFEIDSDTWDMVWLLLDPQPSWRRIADSHQDVRPCQQAVPLYHLISILHHEINGDLSARQVTVKQIINYLRLALADDKDQKKRRQLELLFWHLDARLHYPWTVQELANAMYCSVPHFHRLCHETFGQGPIQQLIHMRMERAKLLLLQTDWSVQEIARRLGYADAFNFSNRFKKSIGIAPSLFRRDACNLAT